MTFKNLTIINTLTQKNFFLIKFTEIFSGAELQKAWRKLPLQDRVQYIKKAYSNVRIIEKCYMCII